jgi:hypothetical protein
LPRKKQSSRPDLFNCGVRKAVAAIGGFALLVVLENRVWGIGPEEASLYLLWLAYWGPVAWLLRDCMYDLRG